MTELEDITVVDNTQSLLKWFHEQNSSSVLIENKTCMRFGDATSSSDGFHTDPDVRLTLEILGFFEDRN